METLTSSAASPDQANYDETAMQFSDSLKDLKNMRKQLYAAAEYFELSFTNDDQKQLVVDAVKDYAVKAIVNTVDHLGAASCKLNDMLSQKVDEISQSELRVSCIQQRLATWQGCFDHEGLAEQSSLINTPKYHKRYILPVGETMQGGIRTKSKYQGCSLEDTVSRHKFMNAGRATIRDKSSPSFRKERSVSPTQQPGSFAFADRKDLDTRAVSPLRFPLLRTGSLSSRPTTPSSRPKTPNPSRPTTPSSVGRQRVSGYQKSASMHIYSNRDTFKETDQTPSKSKRLLKALLSRRKSTKDNMLYTYLDEF